MSNLGSLRASGQVEAQSEIFNSMKINSTKQQQAVAQ